MNIFIKSDENYVKLGDFGHSIHLEGKSYNEVRRDIRGTINYRPIECYITNIPYDPYAVDIFALGVLLQIGRAHV